MHDNNMRIVWNQKTNDMLSILRHDSGIEFTTMLRVASNPSLDKLPEPIEILRNI